jgi:hypothetical protein
MTTEAGGSERLYLTDETGHYFVLTHDLQQPLQIPDDRKGEVDEVLQGQGEAQGFAITPQLSAFPTFNPATQQLNVLGACNGRCGRTFGVLGPQQLR